MRIIGHGIDMVETARIARLLEEHGPRFLRRCYTEQEQSYAADKRRHLEHLAGRFAVKEAVFKALGAGWSGGVTWTDIEVQRLATGQPQLVIQGHSAELARQLGVTQWLVSITHTVDCAMASVIAVGDG